MSVAVLDCSEHFTANKSFNIVFSITFFQRCMPSSSGCTIFSWRIQRMVLLQKEKCRLHRISEHQGLRTIKTFEWETDWAGETGAENCRRRATERDSRTSEIIDFGATTLWLTDDYNCASRGTGPKTGHWQFGYIIGETWCVARFGHCCWHYVQIWRMRCNIRIAGKRWHRMQLPSRRTRIPWRTQILVMLYKTYDRFCSIHEPKGLCVRQA